MTTSVSAFSYEEAFSRNLGWVTSAEQERLRDARVCIAGLGGVGGIYLLTLARLGVGRFSIADFDTSRWPTSTVRPARQCARWNARSST
jgi:tRNA A37 threonylcarbamoyladenosine dehydratase